MDFLTCEFYFALGLLLGFIIGGWVIYMNLVYKKQKEIKESEVRDGE